MADKKYTIEIDVDGNADKKLDDIASSSQKADKSTKRLTKSSNKQSGVMGKLGGVLGSLKMGYAAVAAVVVLAAKRLYAASRAAAVQAAQVGKLARSIREAGGSYNDLKRSQDLARKASNTFGVELNKALNSIQSLTEASGDAKKAQDDFALALDISAQSGQDLETVTNALAEARRGEFEGLKKYVGFNKTVLEALTQTKDRAGATADAFDKLKNSYRGAAAELAGADEDAKAVEASLENIETTVGGLASEVAKFHFGDTFGVSANEFFSSIDEGADVMLRYASAVNDATDAEKEMIGKMVDAGMPRSVALMEFVQTVEKRKSGFSDYDGPAGLILPGDSDSDAPFTGPAPLSEEERIKRMQAAQKERGAKKKAAEEAAKQDALDREARAKDVELRKASIAILEAEGEVTIRKLEHKRELIQISQQDLNNEQEKLALKEAELRLTQDITAIEKRKAEEDKQGVIAQQEAYFQKLKSAEEKREKQEAALASQKEKRLAYEAKLQNDVAEANRQKGDTAIAAAQGAADVAGLFIESEQTKAAMSGAIESARAVSAYASGNIIGGIGHTASAAMFFAAAGGAGQNTGAAAGGGASQSRPSFEERASNRRTQLDREPENTTVQMQFNSTWPASPRNARELTTAVQREMRNRGLGGAR